MLPRMQEQAYRVPPPHCSDRRNVFFFVAKVLSLLGHRFLVSPHIEMDERVLELKRAGGAVFLYCGLHKSLWETSGVLPPLYLAHLPIPYVGMGDNLVKGRLFQKLSTKIGTFLVRRPTTRREVAESARRLRSDVLSFLAHGLDVMLFPEGTRRNIPRSGRYGEFFPAAFDAVLEYERNKNVIVRSNPHLPPYNTYLVPFNVDYTRVREAPQLVAEGGANPQTLHVFDSLGMIRGIGDTYISYGPPARASELLHLNRKELASWCRERCLDLVKILPINVVSCAMLRLPGGGPVAPDLLHEGVRRVVARLQPYRERFRGFSEPEEPAELVRRAAQVQVDFTRVDPNSLALCRLYAAYIAHYTQETPRI
jgi:1-acyl-sn-glycerol-3-phosphate acyltransferase